MTKGVILDLDGPILEGKYRHYKCYSDILREYDFVPVPIDDYWDMKRNRLDRRKQLAASAAEGIYGQFLESWIKRIEKKSYLKLDRLQPGLLDKLRSWKDSGLELVLVTMRNNRNNLIWQLELFGLLPLFIEVITVGAGADQNPKFQAARPFVKKHGRSSIWWIGDTEVDVEAARLLGVKVCAVYCGLRTYDYLADLNPDLLLPYLKAMNFTGRQRI